ncbi:MAG: transglycosylase domain-containing protein [Anaerolineales bacterium]|nr:transglycosylase domain-containing protein [Anaerolineales bacterium]
MINSTDILRRRRRRKAQRQGGGRVLLILSQVVILGLIAIVLLNASVALAGVATVAGFYSYIVQDLPDAADIEKIETDTNTSFQTTKIYDRTGQELLYEIIDPSGGDRQWISIDDIPQVVIDATVASEDKTFWENKGYDLEGMARALIGNIRGEGVQGGSSITQQLVKNALIDPEDRIVSEEGPDFDDYVRKAREVLLANEITRRYEKEKILEWYLNTNWYGNLAYGIEAAARVYFDKSARELTLPEAAMLAPIPQYAAQNPFDNPDEAVNRQQLVLDFMVRDNYITEEEMVEAKFAPLTYAGGVEERYDILEPHFSIYARKQLEEMFGEKLVYQGGLKVITSINLDLQHQAECVARIHVKRLAGNGYEPSESELAECPAARYLPALSQSDVNKDHNVSNASLVALDPTTGEILVMAGSLDFWNEDIDGQYNVALANRQPGSSFKPFTYVTALAQGYTPATMILDVKAAVPPGPPAFWPPANYDRKEHGPVSMRQALANSYNLPAVIAMDWVGVDNVVRTAHHMGITTIDYGSECGLALTLGCGEVKLLDMVYSFSVFDNLGVMIGEDRAEEEIRSGYRELDPVSILYVEDKDGNVLYQYTEPKRREILTPQLAWLMNSMMSDRSARCPGFGCPNALELPDERPAAAKTGTTNDYKDAWTIGFTPQLAAGVWVGNSDNASMVDTPGSKGAAPIWNAFMSYAMQDKPIQTWTQPSGINQMSVCATSGLLPTQWCPTKTEYFINGTEPTTVDTIYQAVRINRETQKLATVFTPPELVEEKVYTLLPPEAADWLASLSEEASERWPQPPTEYDTIQGQASGTGPVAIISPLPYAYVNGQVELYGNVQMDNLAFYRIAFGSGLNPSAWQLIGSEHGETRNNELLEVWDVSGLDGLYSVQLTAVRHDQSIEQATIQVTVDNTPPEIFLSFPLADQEFFWPDDEWVTIQPLVQDNVSMDRVEFYVDNQMVGSSAVAPFTYQWVIRGSAGGHNLHAIAYDAAGNSTESDSVKIWVTNVSQ